MTNATTGDVGLNCRRLLFVDRRLDPGRYRRIQFRELMQSTETISARKLRLLVLRVRDVPLDLDRESSRTWFNVSCPLLSNGCALLIAIRRLPCCREGMKIRVNTVNRPRLNSIRFNMLWNILLKCPSNLAKSTVAKVSRTRGKTRMPKVSD